MPIDDATRDVTPCEQLILQIRHIYIQVSQGKKLEEMPIRWDYIDTLKRKCNVLPSDYVAMLAELENHRPKPDQPT